MNREEALDVLLQVITKQMIITKEKMTKYPALGYGQFHDRIEEAKQYLLENLK